MTDETEGEEGYSLTRRDALAALAAAGVAAGGAVTLSRDGVDGGGPEDGAGDASGTGDVDDVLGSHERETLVAVAETVYPDAVDGVAGFVETWTAGRVADRPAHAGGIADAVATLDGYARERADAPFVALDRERRDDLLRGVGVDVADPDPDGIDPARLRYYLVNDLLYALYTSPTGGELVGIENPQGHPGGTDSYQHGPDA